MAASLRRWRQQIATFLQAATFLHAARRYWQAVFPTMRLELRCWRRRAEGVPDACLRSVALAVQEGKLGNIEGAAAFAAFAPPSHCRAVVRAQVAFQAIYDLADSLAEQPSESPEMNGRALHSALLDALSGPKPAHRYYAHHPQREDGGYLTTLARNCSVAFGQLPSRRAVQAVSLRFAARIVAYQSLNLAQSAGGLRALAQWARAQTPAGCGLRWWEIAASAGSSLGVFALLSSASERDVQEGEAEALERVYFPWIGSLHSLLDSLIDAAEDLQEGQPNLISHYQDEVEAAARVSGIASEASRRAAGLAHRQRHRVILAGMASYYLSAQQARLPEAAPVADAVLDAVGGLSVLAMAVFRVRRAIGRPT